MNHLKPILVCLQCAGAGLLQAQLSDQEIYDRKAGRFRPDTSYVYWLPFAPGERFLLVQAANSHMSHKKELSFDFKMKKGSRICAARATKQ